MTPSILLVDDIPSNLRILYESLNGRDYRLLIANGGAQALEIARRSHPDLMLLDVMMPDLDGFDVCRQLKADPATATIGVIFLSARDAAADKVRGLALGGVDYVTKPFHPEEIAARVAIHCTILRMDRELASRNRQLELVRDRILSSMTEGVVGLDAGGQVEFANPAATALLGAAMLDLPLAAWQPPDLSETVGRVLGGQDQFTVAELDLAATGTAPLPVELRVAAINARPLPAPASPRPPADPAGQPHPGGGDDPADAPGAGGAVLVVRDLRERQRVAAALAETNNALRQSHRELKVAQMQLIQAAKLETVGQLAAGVAHEVKNPLAVIQLGMDFLEQTLTLDQTSATVFADMQQALLRADTVVRGLLDFSRERGLDLTPDSLNRLINVSLQLVRHELVQRNIKVITELASALPEQPFDADKMQQVLLNLFMNAMHAMERDGTLRIATGLHRLRDEELGPQARAAGFLGGDLALRLLIEDSGPGIAADHLDRLFDPYFSTKPMGEGTGLGLSVTRNIVNLHRGSIDIGNRDSGRGARVVLLFHADAAPLPPTRDGATSIAAAVAGEPTPATTQSVSSPPTEVPRGEETHPAGG